MPPDFVDFDTLISRFNRLSTADKNAVLQRIPIDDRDFVLAAITQRTQVRRAEVEMARVSKRDFVAYSPWLARLVRAAEAETGIGLTARAVQAVIDSHAGLHSDGNGMRPTLLDRMRKWIALLSTRSNGGAR